MIIVIDYDAGNTANVLRALEKIGVTAELSADKEKILDADGLILPGVGAYPTAMAELERRGLVAVIKEAVAQGVPLLGICLGMQILTEKGWNMRKQMVSVLFQVFAVLFQPARSNLSHIWGGMIWLLSKPAL